MQNMAAKLSPWKIKNSESSGQSCESDAVTSRVVRNTGYNQQVISGSVAKPSPLHRAFHPNQ
jgi:hypothetical protein